MVVVVEMLQNLHVLLSFGNVQNPVPLPCKTTSERQKVLRTRQFFYTFDFDVCFAPQRRALFSTSQLQKVLRTWCVFYILTWKRASRYNGVHFFDIATAKSGPDLVCFVHFDLETCFAPHWSAIFHLSPTALASLLFDPPEPQIIGKNAVFRDFPTFRAPASWASFDFPSPLLSSPLLSSPLLFSSLLFSSLLFSGSSLFWLFPSLLFICTHCRKFDF